MVPQKSLSSDLGAQSLVFSLGMVVVRQSTLLADVNGWCSLYLRPGVPVPNSRDLPHNCLVYQNKAPEFTLQYYHTNCFPPKQPKEKLLLVGIAGVSVYVRTEVQLIRLGRENPNCYNELRPYGDFKNLLM